MAKATGDSAVVRALDPEREQSSLAMLVSLVVSFLLFIVAWVNGAPYANEAGRDVFTRMYNLSPGLDPKLDKAVNEGKPPTKAKFVKNVDKFVKSNPTLDRFFKGKTEYIQGLAQKAAALQDDPTTPLGRPDLLPKTIKVSMHQQVIYCDDSGSMRKQGRWEGQEELVKRITRVSTRILPDGEGVALRFINQDTENSPNLSLAQFGDIMKSSSPVKGGDTQIGTNLRSKILEPLVYDKLKSETLDRPLLVSVITDGMPSHEDKDRLVNEILDCGARLDLAGYPRESVKFLIGQIGTGNAAADFLEGIREKIANDEDFARVAYCTTDQLDAKFAEFHDNEAGLDQWLIETLFAPIKGREDPVDESDDNDD